MANVHDLAARLSARHQLFCEHGRQKCFSCGVRIVAWCDWVTRTGPLWSPIPGPEMEWHEWLIRSRR